MELKDQVITNVNIASDIFENLYPTFDLKIELLSNVFENSKYAKECANSSEIYKAVKILGENAVEEIPRRYQQQYLANLVKVIMSNPSYDELHDFFVNNNVLFNAFCLMYIHFQDDAISDKEREAHSFMLNHILNCVKLIISKK